jgi:hypothetical protein
MGAAEVTFCDVGEFAEAAFVAFALTARLTGIVTLPTAPGTALEAATGAELCSTLGVAAPEKFMIPPKFMTPPEL